MAAVSDARRLYWHGTGLAEAAYAAFGMRA